MIEGPLLVREALRAGWPLDDVFVGDGVELDLGGVEITTVAAGVLERVATTVTSRPVIAVGRMRQATLADTKGATFLVVLDGVADPGNLGTIVRTAESAGADAVVVCGGVDVFNPKCVRASAGALFFLPIVSVSDGRAAVAELASIGLRIVGTSSHATGPYDDVDLTRPLALVLGSESRGIAAWMAGALDEIVAIPIAGRSESLNVAAAAAVLCFEVARQRRSS